ncbi:MAG: outer membrane protein assembly factor BamA [Spirochaetaceae bacterium]|jgi:outer membrane protein insertion porin family|nr:outer membrane protein assembly factor BamA [Spirochaetaceae bacterium]
MRVRLALILMGLAVFSVFSQQSDDWYQGKPVKEILFEGLKHVKLAELEEVVESFKGRLFDDALFWELQGRLYALEYFEMITPSAVPADPLGIGNEVIIKFTVVERPIVSRINLSGNNHLRRREIMETISIKVNDVVNQVKLRADELAIINKYLEKGYPDIKVRSQMDVGNNSTMVITFFIEEGEKIAIESLNFEGNQVFSTKTLRSQLSLKPKGIFVDGAFQESKLLVDQDTVIQYYRDRGYIDAELVDVMRSVQKDKKGNNNMTITFKIVEGRQYLFGGVVFEGNQIFPTETLSEKITSKVGEVVNARKVETDLQRVADLYYENGYIFNSIGREEVRDSQNGMVTYKIPIVERGRAHIENIIVRGNAKTKPHVILREIPLESGDVFSKTKVMEGWRNLMNLQYFTVVAPDTPPGSEDSLMDLIFNVEEQPTMDIQVGMNFSGISEPGQVPISFMLKWSDRNFLGYGNMLGVDLNISYYTQSFTVEYTHRWVFGIPLSMSFDFTGQHTRRLGAMDNNAPYFNGDEPYAFPDGFNSYEEYVNASKTPPSEFLMHYDQWRFSLGVSTGYRFPTIAGNLGFGGGVRSGIVLNQYDESLYRAFDPAIRDQNNKWTPANSVWTSVSLDQRDIYYDPSKGYYGIQRFGYYGIFPIELEHYFRTDTKAEFFHTLLAFQITDTYILKFIFGIHSGLSFIFPQPNRDAPAVENPNKLSVDGMFVGRGWTNEYYIKGLALWENWAEVRIPFVPGMLAFDLFFDAAAVKDTPRAFFSDFSIEDMRFSLGGQFRFALPQFPIRLGIAKRFKVVDGSVEWQKGNILDAVDLVFSFAISTY